MDHMGFLGVADLLSQNRQSVRRYTLVAFGGLALIAAGSYFAALDRSPGTTIFDHTVALARYGFDWSRYLVQTGDFRALQSAPPIILLETAGLYGLAVVTITAIIAAAFANLRPHAYGEGRYATRADLKKMRLTGTIGPILGRSRGRLRGRLLRPMQPRHTLVVAPNRTGKTRGIVIPSIVDYPGSVVTLDVKGELLDLTAKARQAKGPVYVLDWANPDSPNSWSPLGRKVLPENPLELERHVERVAATFFPPTSGQEKYWADTARRNAAALMLYEAYRARDRDQDASIAAITEELAALRSGENDNENEDESKDEKDPKDPFGDHMLRLAAAAEVHGYPRRITQDLTIFANTSYRERSTHVNSLMTGLQLFRLDAVAKATSSSDFSFDELRRKPCTVYIRYPAQDAQAFGHITAVFLTSLFAAALDRDPDKDTLPILIALDEFASLPKINLFSDIVAKGAGQGVQLLPVIQDIAQVEEVYGRTGVDNLFTNSSYIVAMAQNNDATAKKLSTLVGNRTRTKKTTSGTWLKSVLPNVSQADEGVPVIRPEQWGEIPFGKHILLAENFRTRPVLCETPFWDQTPSIREKMK